MGSQRRSRRLLGLTPDIPEFYSCDDREKLRYIQSNLRRVLRLRTLLDAALAAAGMHADPGPKQPGLLPPALDVAVGSPFAADSSSRPFYFDEEAQILDGGPSSSSHHGAAASPDSLISSTSGGPIRRSRACKRVEHRSTPAAALDQESKCASEGTRLPPRSRGRRRRSVIAIVDDGDRGTA